MHIVGDAQVDADDIVYIELEVMDEIEQTEDEHQQHKTEQIEETDEIDDIELYEVKQHTVDVTLGIHQVVNDETLGEECIDQEYLYEVIDTIIVLTHIEVMVEMDEIHHQIIALDESDEMQQVVEQCISYTEERLQNDVLIYLLEKVDVDDQIVTTIEQMIDVIDTQEKNSFLKYIFK